MKIYDTYIKNSLKRENKKLLSLKITIFIAVAVLSIFILIMGSFIKNNQEMAIRFLGDFHTIIVADMNEKKVDQLEKNVNIEKIGFIHFLGLEKDKNSDFTYRVDSMDSNYLEIWQNQMVTGQLPTQEGEIIVPNSLFNDLNLKIGDKIDTKTENGEDKRYTITGFYDKSSYNWERDEDSTWQKVYSVYTYKDANSIKNKANGIMIWYKDMKKTYELTPEIFYFVTDGGNYEYAMENNLFMYNDIYLSSHFVNSKDFYTNTPAEKAPKILFIGSIIIGGFFIILIKNILNIWENKNSREYGLLISIGATKKDLVKLIIKRLWRLSHIPILIGLVTGIALDFIFVKIVDKFYILSQENSFSQNIYSIKFTISPILIALILVVTLLVLAIVSLWPIVKVYRLSPIESMLEYKVENKHFKKKKKHSIKGTSFLKDLFKISQSTHRKKMLLSSLAISISIFILSIMLALSSGLNLDLTYNSRDELEYYDYKIEYTNPDPFPDKVLKELTGDYKTDYITYRKMDMYLDEKNDYKGILDDEYLNQYYPKYTEDIGESQISANIVGVENNQFEKIVEEIGLNIDDFQNTNSCIIINSFPKYMDRPYSMIEYGKLFNEKEKNLLLNEFKSSFNNEEELNNPICMNVIAYIDNPNILKIPQSQYEFMVLMPMNNYQSILSEVKYPNEDMLSESIYLKESKNQTFEDIKNIINKNFNTKNIKVYNRENIKAFERNSSNILFTLLSIFSLIAGAVGLSASYSATDSIRRMQSKEYALFQIVGMDRKSLKKLVLKEVNYNTRTIVVLSLTFILISAFLGSTAYKCFGTFKILRNMKIYIIVIYIVLIYLIMRRNYLKILKDMDLTMNRRML